MNIKELIDFIREKMKEKPGLFMFRDNEPKATVNDISYIESILLAKLPHSYLEIQKIFGGGTFGFGEIFSICSDSDYFVLTEYENYKFIPSKFFPVSSDGVGGYYGFIKDGDVFKDEIYYLDYDLENIQLEKKEWNFIQFFMWSAFNIDEN
ncbi:SMI1/KNR4 family protein [Aggregatibacter actinomycetemcomitans]|uniref:SMI1/KNR4 family protein n=1 Tax=Aggregatibacter actinomycetemcomitans TaxID=714 RepID=UPI00197B415F|nr:SMI1/KNR4 family protein [Aggregatibacter actinomycetemcomitans]MBN6073760.1 SMI1/KNR4 family protein [Aggregatibacter actinomycetemcomitans]